MRALKRTMTTYTAFVIVLVIVTTAYGQLPPGDVQLRRV
jgi:hypothetical protein